MNNAAAFGRLCVETRLESDTVSWVHAAAFGRLCVETAACATSWSRKNSSRLRAAVC